MKQVFSLKLFIEFCQKNGYTYLETLEAVELWAKDYVGLTKEQVMSLANNNSKMETKILDEWFEFMEE